MNDSSVALLPLDLNALAAATSQCVDDPATLAYLLRAARRVQDDKAEGFALVNADGSFLHFAWATQFEGFVLAELNAAVAAPSTDSVMLFDCWTPAASLGHGYYARAVDLVARLVWDRGQRPWIFSAANNRASVRGLEKTAFQKRYTLTRKRWFGLQWIDGETPRSAPRSPGSEKIPPVPEDSAA